MTEIGRPIGFRSIIGEFVALAGFPLPPTAIGTLIGFRLMIGDTLGLPDETPPAGSV